MRNIISLISCLFIALVLFQYRISTIHPDKPLKVTDWDAMGYYMYLPATVIYHDIEQLNWIPAIDSQYAMTGGNGYPAQKADNGNYVDKYLGGVAIMEAPFFLIGHCIAKYGGYPADGFSAPYQYALGFGVILYCILAVFLLRKVLLRYYGDLTVAVTLMLLCLATNFIQYASVDNGQSHGYIFLLYVLILCATIKWHERPTTFWAAAIGFIIGLAMISRPTEAIMLSIPLLWNTHTREAAKEKWAMVKSHKGQWAIVALFGLLAMSPQLVYWKMVSGQWVYDVGSKWVFLNPHFRVLFGWEKGWFIYTPVTVLFVVGLFFIKKYPFRKSVLWFCILNIWIIIAWDEWRYGGSYSTRALVQSYPVFALPLGALVQRVNLKKWRIVFYALGVYLIGVNLFQTWQYDKTILHYDDMNRKYYGRIYLNPNPSPLDMSLLDTDEMPDGKERFNEVRLGRRDDTSMVLHKTGDGQVVLYEDSVKTLLGNEVLWIKVEAKVAVKTGLWKAMLNGCLQRGDSTKQTAIRLFNPVGEETHQYAFYIQVPEYFRDGKFKLYIASPGDFEGRLERLQVIRLYTPVKYP